MPFYFQVGSLEGYYHFKHIGNSFRGRRSTHEKTSMLMSEDEVRTRSIFNLLQSEMVIGKKKLQQK